MTNSNRHNVTTPAGKSSTLTTSTNNTLSPPATDKSNTASSSKRTSTSAPPSQHKTKPAASTPSNNYAAPYTPIASAKRPRGQNSAMKSNGKTMTNGGRRNRSSIGTSQHTNGREIIKNQKKEEEELNLTPVRKMKLSDDDDDDDVDRKNNNADFNRVQMSPMHKPRPAIEKEEEIEDLPRNEKTWVGIFSPVLNFLTNSNEGDSGEEKVLDADGDIDMANTGGGVDENTMPSAENDTHTHNEDTPTSAGSFSTSQNSMDADDIYQDNNDEVNQETMEQYHQASQGNEEEEEQGHEEEEEEEEEFNPYLFIKFLPMYQTVVPHPEHKICLPPKDKTDPPITLVLDLDETLVHCTVEPISDATMVFPVFFNGMQYSVHVRTRPYLKEFLESVSKKFEVVVFTASQKVYANELLNRIDPGKL